MNARDLPFRALFGMVRKGSSVRVRWRAWWTCRGSGSGRRLKSESRDTNGYVIAPLNPSPAVGGGGPRGQDRRSRLFRGVRTNPPNAPRAAAGLGGRRAGRPVDARDLPRDPAREPRTARLCLRLRIPRAGSAEGCDLPSVRPRRRRRRHRRSPELPRAARAASPSCLAALWTTTWCCGCARRLSASGCSGRSQPSSRGAVDDLLHRPRHRVQRRLAS